jgi:hypothetical protein
MNTGDKDLDTFLYLMLILFGGVVIIFIGLYVVLPAAVIYGIYQTYKWFTKPPPATTEELYRQSQITYFPEPVKFTEQFMVKFSTANAPHQWPRTIIDAMVSTTHQLYKNENLAGAPMRVFEKGTREEARYRDQLIAQANRAYDPLPLIETMHAVLTRSFQAYINSLPSIALTKTSDAMFRVALQDAIPNLNTAVQNVVLPFCAENITVFKGVKEAFTNNVVTVSENKKSILPTDYKGTQVVDSYLLGTPLHHLFECSIPFDFDDKSRIEHFHLCAGSGWGKTQLIQSLILRDLQKPDPSALIIIDSQQDMLDKIQRLALFNGKLADRLVIIDPVYTPALNMFDTTTDRLKNYSRTDREQIEAGIIELYNYVFGAIAAELTSKQNVAFSFVVRLMLATPHATLHTLLELMESNDFTKFIPVVAKLDTTAQSFFQNQFFKKDFGATRQQIARRLYTVLSVPSFDRMFSTRENKLDMFDCIQSRKIVLVNTRKALLKTDACALFGRYMIAQTMSAVFERVAVQEKQRTPAFLIIDEAADYFDESLESLLTQARKYHCGVLFAHQAMSQMSQSLQGIVAGNTSIKVAGGISDKDARALGPDMRTTSEFLTNLKKTQDYSEFAAYIRNKTGRALSIEVPFGTLEAMPKMSNAEHKVLIARNNARYSASAPPEPPEPIVRFTTRPPEMEPWRLDSADKKPPPSTPANDDTHTKPSKDY